MKSGTKKESLYTHRLGRPTDRAILDKTGIQGEGSAVQSFGRESCRRSSRKAGMSLG